MSWARSAFGYVEPAVPTDERRKWQNHYYREACKLEQRQRDARRQRLIGHLRGAMA